MEIIAGSSQDEVLLWIILLSGIRVELCVDVL